MKHVLSAVYDPNAPEPLHVDGVLGIDLRYRESGHRHEPPKNVMWAIEDRVAIQHTLTRTFDFGFRSALPSFELVSGSRKLEIGTKKDPRPVRTGWDDGGEEHTV
jgi:hypothetical protein